MSGLWRWWGGRPGVSQPEMACDACEEKRKIVEQRDQQDAYGRALRQIQASNRYTVERLQHLEKCGFTLQCRPRPAAPEESG